MNAAPSPFATSSFVSRSDSRPPWPVSDDEWLQNMSYHYVSQHRRAAAGRTPLPPPDYFIPTASPPSSGRAKMSPSPQCNDDVPAVVQHDDFPAKAQPLACYRLCKSDRAMRAKPSNKFEDEIAPSTPYTRRNRKRSTRDEVPERHGPSAMEQEAHKAINLLEVRVEFAAKRVHSMDDVVVKLRDVLANLTAKKTLAMDQAAPLEEVAAAASSTLKMARTEISAAKTRLESSSRPRRLLDYFKAKWDTAPRPLDVDQAERRGGEAVWALRSARSEADRAWEVVHNYSNKAEAALRKLHNVEYAHTSARNILVDLEAELDRAKHHAVRTAREVKVGRCLVGEVYARGRGGEMSPLLVAARIAARFEDDFGDNQVVPRTKRARH